MRWKEFSFAQWLWYWLLVHEVTGSNPAWTLYFCHAFIHLFLYCGLCSKETDKSFIELCFRSTDQVGQRMMIGYGGMAASGLAIVAAFGFCAAIGVEFVSIVGTTPFLIVGEYVKPTRDT